MKSILWLLMLAALFLPNLSTATTADEYYAAGLAVLKDNDYERAIKYFHQAVVQKEDYWQAYHYMGVAYYQMGNRTEALVAMRESLKLHPNNEELRKFIKSQVEGNSPWLSTTSWTAKLAWVAFFLSLLTAGWVGFWSWKLKPWKTGVSSRG